jgi:hypothetical protein
MSFQLSRQSRNVFIDFLLGKGWEWRGGGLQKSRGLAMAMAVREPISAILKLFPLESSFFIMKLNDHLSSCKIKKKMRFLEFLLSGADFGHFEAISIRIKLFQNEMQWTFELLKNQKKKLFVECFWI